MCSTSHVTLPQSDHPSKLIALSMLYPVSRLHFIALMFYTINVVGFQSLSHSIKQVIKTVDLVDPALRCVRECTLCNLHCGTGRGLQRALVSMAAEEVRQREKNTLCAVQCESSSAHLTQMGERPGC